MAKTLRKIIGTTLIAAGLSGCIGYLESDQNTIDLHIYHEKGITSYSVGPNPYSCGLLIGSLVTSLIGMGMLTHDISYKSNETKK